MNDSRLTILFESKKVNLLLAELAEHLELRDKEHLLSLLPWKPLHFKYPYQKEGVEPGYEISGLGKAAFSWNFQFPVSEDLTYYVTDTGFVRHSHSESGEPRITVELAIQLQVDERFAILEMDCGGRDRSLSFHPLRQLCIEIGKSVGVSALISNSSEILLPVHRHFSDEELQALESLTDSLYLKDEEDKSGVVELLVGYSKEYIREVDLYVIAYLNEIGLSP